jgi:hypothetical protein
MRQLLPLFARAHAGCVAVYATLAAVCAHFENGVISD